MYELMFGITSAPFALTPDPAFFFGAQAHRRALETLRNGIGDPSGFTVLTGAIGAGKTMLLHRLVSALSPAEHLVGEIVSTQLDAHEVLAAAAHALHLASEGDGLDSPAQRLTELFAELRVSRRGAILTVDEAQNLAPDALLRLLWLSSMASTEGVSLHIFLVGQTELLAILESDFLAPLKPHIRASFQLGALAAGEVRSYVEYRLQRAGWNGNPSFEEEAFAEIFHWTEGVPRRINLLCNRLLLSRFLDRSSLVAVATVRESAAALQKEIAAPESDASNFVDRISWTTTHTDFDTVPVIGSAQASLSKQHIPLDPESDDDAPVSGVAEECPGPVMCLLAEDGDCKDAAVLIRGMARRSGASSVLLMRVFRRDKDKKAWERALGPEILIPMLDLDLRHRAELVHGGELRHRFISACQEARPSALVVFSPTDASLVCSIAARQRRIPVVSVGPAARDRRHEAARNELAKRLWLALHPAPDLRP